MHLEKISQKKPFLILQKMETLKKFLIFSQKKAFLIFQEMELSYIWERYIQNPGIFRTLISLELETYTEP